jgi:hypothetical protein
VSSLFIDRVTPPPAGATRRPWWAAPVTTLEQLMARVTGNEDHRISLEAAKALTQRHRAERRESKERGEPNEHSGVMGHYVGRAVLEEMLRQPGCVGIRLYHARHDDGRPTLVAVGVNAEANDLIEGTIAEEMYPCPPYCSAPNPLNS